MNLPKRKKNNCQSFLFRNLILEFHCFMCIYIIIQTVETALQPLIVQNWWKIDILLLSLIRESISQGEGECIEARLARFQRIKKYRNSPSRSVTLLTIGIFPWPRHPRTVTPVVGREFAECISRPWRKYQTVRIVIAIASRRHWPRPNPRAGRSPFLLVAAR